MFFKIVLSTFLHSTKLHQWCNDVGGGIKLEYEQKRPRVNPTPTDKTNPFWVAFESATSEL